MFVELEPQLENSEVLLPRNLPIVDPMMDADEPKIKILEVIKAALSQPQLARARSVEGLVQVSNDEGSDVDHQSPPTCGRIAI